MINKILIVGVFSCSLFAYAEQVSIDKEHYFSLLNTISVSHEAYRAALLENSEKKPDAKLLSLYASNVIFFQLFRNLI